MNRFRKTTMVLFSTLLLTTVVMNAESRKIIEVPAFYFIRAADDYSFGPSALRIAPDGTFWIVNPADNTITNVDKDGRMRSQLRLSDEATGITDIRFSQDGEITVLDAAAKPPALLNVTAVGTVRDRKQMRSSQKVFDRSKVSNQDEPLTSSTFSLERTDHSPVDHWRIRSGTDADPTGRLTSDSGRIEVKATRGVIRGLRALTENERGVFLLVEEVVDGDPIAVDATVRLYTRSGELLGLGRVPLTDQFTYVENPVAVSSEGNVYLLTTAPGRVEISLLPLVSSIPDILPEPREHSSDERSQASGYALQATPSISRDQIIANASAYLNNTTYYSQSALTGGCSGRTAPRYLGTTPRNISSVPYDWGGFDSIGGYNSFIAAGKQAGDIDTSSSESCSRGVDCSGYLTRAFGLGGDGTKYSACSLSSVTTVISLSSLTKGDILTRCSVPNRGDHAVLFRSFASLTGGAVSPVGSQAESSGIIDYESTTDNQYDSVVHVYSSWSRLNGYTPRRYNSIAACPGSYYGGSLSQGAVAVQPNGTYFNAIAGSHSGSLSGPIGTDFDLYLYRWGGSEWVMVASGVTTSNNELVSYRGVAGYYLWLVKAYRGSGFYFLCISSP